MAADEAASPVRAPRPPATYVTSVARVQRIAGGFTRLTFAGGDLARFRSVGPDQFVYLLLPPAGRDQLTIDSTFGWEQYRAMPEAERPIGAYYTVRHHRVDVGEIDIDVLMHAHPGPASSWAGGATPGAAAALWGPRTAYDPPKGTSGLVLVGDETAIPAIASILESLPSGTSARVIVETDGPAHHVPLESRATLEVDWLHRGAGEAGLDSMLPDAVRQLEPLDGTYVWGGGEIAAMNEIRGHLRDERRMPPATLSLIGYWRHDAHRHTPET